MEYYLVFTVTWLMALFSCIDRQRDLLYSGFSCILLTVFAGLRGHDMWTDSDYYYWIFNNPFDESKAIEYGFRIWNYVIGSIGEDYTVYLLITHSVIFLLLYMALIKMGTKNVALSMAVYCTSYYLASGGQRQFFAISICFFAYSFLLKKQWIKFLIAVFIASSIHVTSVVLLVAPFIVNLKMLPSIIKGNLGYGKLALLFAVGGIFNCLDVVENLLVDNLETLKMSSHIGTSVVTLTHL